MSGTLFITYWLPEILLTKDYDRPNHRYNRREYSHRSKEPKQPRPTFA
jgi:hypothetical protein